MKKKAQQRKHRSLLIRIIEDEQSHNRIIKTKRQRKENIKSCSTFSFVWHLERWLFESFSRSYKYTDYREFACPICRKKTAIPTGGVHKLPDNFLIAGLSEMISQKSSAGISTIKISTNCEICKAVHDREREASSRCLECQKSLCRHCVQAHQTITVTRDHSIYELEIEKDILCKVRRFHLV